MSARLVRLLLSLLCGWLAAGESTPPLALSRVFNSHEQQLMFPPATSLAILDWTNLPAIQCEPDMLDAKRGIVLVEPIGRYMTAFDNVRRTFFPPLDQRCLGFIDEAGRGDVARCRFTVGGLQIIMAKSENMRAITVVGVLRDGSPLAVAQRVADRIFEPGAGVVLKWLGQQDGVDFGEHIHGMVEDGFGEDWSNWHQVLKWWHKDGAVGFILREFTWNWFWAEQELTRRWFFPPPEEE